MSVAAAAALTISIVASGSACVAAVQQVARGQTLAASGLMLASVAMAMAAMCVAAGVRVGLW